ncbi:hypothetical protein HDU76_002454 [Blyttiomyces sp. JEL0837]|nr:hypothetical protein HDU76_002454 [Blyttiomyces sp. JEL0837]
MVQTYASEEGAYTVLINNYPKASRINVNQDDKIRDTTSCNVPSIPSTNTIISGSSHDSSSLFSLHAGATVSGSAESNIFAVSGHGGGKKKVPTEPMDPIEYWSIMTAIFFLVMLGGMFAGLTIGLMSIDETNLSILKRSGTPTEKMYAERIEPIRKNAHLLLVTLLLANTVVNETLPILFSLVELEGYQAVLFSTLLVLVFGEIIPQAVCARYGLQVGAIFAWPVRILIWLEFVIAYPIAKLLDYILGHKDGVIYRRAQLKELITMHDEVNQGPLTQEEVSILRAVLELRDKTVQNVMTHLEDVQMVPLTSKLDRETMQTLMDAGHSRVPVYNASREDIIGVVLVKQLVLLDPDDAIPLADIRIGRLPRIRNDTPLYEILHVFEEGGSHMAVVVEEIPIEQKVPNSYITSSPLWVAASPRVDCRRFRTLGIVTLEDVIEELIGQEIVDETDVYVDVATKVKVGRAFHELEKKIRSTPGTSRVGNFFGALSPLSHGVNSSATIDEEIGEIAPLLPPPATPRMNSGTDYGGTSSLTVTSNLTVSTTAATPVLGPQMTPRCKPARRFREELVPAAQLLEESRLGSRDAPPTGPLQGLRIQDSIPEHMTSDQNPALSQAIYVGPVVYGNRALGRMGTDSEIYVVDGAQGEFRLDGDILHGSPPALDIDAQPLKKNGELERLD